MSAYVDDISENRRDDLMRVIRGAVEQPGRASVGRPIDEAVADAVIAWIDSGGVVVEEPEWEVEYGVRGDVDSPMSSRDAAEHAIERMAKGPRGYRIIRSLVERRVSPWVPVKREGAETDA